jgi:tRNA threonylcarbamoyladenosine biosynthesis protein TsaB
MVLGFDTATSATAVALRTGEGSTSEARDDPAAGAHPGHATRLLSMARELLDGAGVSWEEIDRIAVGVGPGTFTGLRVGAATARGLAQSLSVELVGVSSLRALAVPALATGGPPRAGVLAVIDARRGEAFAAPYGCSAAGALVELRSPRPYAPGELAGLLAEVSGQSPGDPQATRPWLAVGDGAIRYREELAGVAEIPAGDSRLHLVTAAAICELAAAADPGDANAGVLPDYRRRPDAEIALEAAAARAGSES